MSWRYDEYFWLPIKLFCSFRRDNKFDGRMNFTVRDVLCVLGDSAALEKGSKIYSGYILTFILRYQDINFLHSYFRKIKITIIQVNTANMLDFMNMLHSIYSYLSFYIILSEKKTSITRQTKRGKF